MSSWTRSGFVRFEVSDTSPGPVTIMDAAGNVLRVIEIDPTKIKATRCHRHNKVECPSCMSAAKSQERKQRKARWGSGGRDDRRSQG